MTTTMQLIAKQTIGSGGASSVTFSNIPQTYTDLKLVYSARSSAAVDGDSAVIRFNTDTTSGNYTGKRILGAGSGTPSSSSTNTGLTITAGANNTASTFSNGEIYIPNYTGSTAKSVSIDSANENNATTAYAVLGAMLWSGTAAVSTLTLTLETGPNFTEFSTFYLYGISNSTTTQASTVPYASGGDVITTDGTYWYHTFLYSGTFTPLKALTCDYLVVAGGGAGGGNIGGGGGAGGARSTVTATGGGGTLETALSLTANTAYTATVGAGGAGTIQTAGNATNSVFGSITSTAGGGGGAYYTYVGQNGGSGGGAAANTSTYSGGTNASPTQGYSGGQNYAGSVNVGAAGGGGGAGSNSGTNAGNNTGGAGGSGLTTSISGASKTYAGGGGGSTFSTTVAGSGGTGGSGGGGNGAIGTSYPVAGGNGFANTGSGGGGGSRGDGLGGNGGSGIIIIRYSVA